MKRNMFKLLCVSIISFIVLFQSGVIYAIEYSSAPDGDYVTAANNAGKPDTLKFSGLYAGDVVKVYNSASGGKLLGYGTVYSPSTEATVTVAQLGTSGGSVFASVTEKGKQESSRTKIDFPAEPVSDAPGNDSITIINNVGLADTVKVTSLSAGDSVKVYDSATAGKLLGSATVPAAKTEIALSLKQIGSSAGSIYISVTSKGKLESSRTKADFSAETRSDAPMADNIFIVNNVGISDTIKVTNLSASDTVKVYDSALGGKLLGSATVPSGKTEVTVSIKQIGGDTGSIYIAVTNKGKLESDRIKADFSAETRSDAPVADNILIVNNAGTSDTVKMTDLSAGDIVKVYDSAVGGKLLGSATVPNLKTEATVTISQLGSAAGNVYVTVTSKAMLESARSKIGFSAEIRSDASDVDSISIVNNVGASDTVKVSNLSAGDVVKVYDSASGGKLLGSAAVSGSGTEATVTISQLGSAAGSAYVAVTSKGKSESDRVKADYSAEPRTDAIDADFITIINNGGIADTVNVTDLSSGDTVKVYDSATGGKLLGSATVPDSISEVTISITQLGTAAGSVYITATNKGKLESDRVKANYSAEQKSDAIDPVNVTIDNNAGMADTVKVIELDANDILKVYSSMKSVTPLGSATAASNSSEATVTITQLGTAAGSVYISITNRGKQESDRIKMDFTAEPKSDALDAGNITVVNYAGISDIVKVTELTENDVIKVYSSAKSGNLLGTATVPAYGTEAAVTVTQLGTAAGSVYVTVTSKGKLENDRVKADYSAEPKSDAPTADNISIVNNAGMADTVKVTDLTANDVIKVYNAAKSGNLLGTATVATYGTEAAVTVTQLGIDTGNVYVSLTSKGKLESDRVKVNFAAESKSNTSGIGNIIVTNNAGMPDTIKVTGINAGDAVKVYDAARSGNLLGTATVPAYGTEAAVSVTQLGTGTGSVYVSVTGMGKLESDRIKADYMAESKSDNPLINNTTIINNAGMPDTIKITFLASDDIVKVYDSLSGGNMIGSATVPGNSAEVTITVGQLGMGAGNVYISITAKGKLESDRVKAFYTAEPMSDAPDAGNITVVNNAGMSDTVRVTFADTDDLIKVYDSAAGGKLLGSSVASASSAETVVTIAQLGSSAGNVYVSITGKGKLESDRTKAYYAKESKSDAPVTGNITITNNVGMADTVKVTGLASNDIVSIYDSAANGKLLTSAAVLSDSSEAIAAIKQLGTTAGNIYVTVTEYGKLESDRIRAGFSDELKTTAPDTNDVVVTNNASASDKVKVSALAAGDIVRIYDSASEGRLLGFATVPADGTYVTITVNQLGTSDGSIYISVTGIGKMESDRTKVTFEDEAQ